MFVLMANLSTMMELMIPVSAPVQPSLEQIMELINVRLVRWLTAINAMQVKLHVRAV